MLVAVTMPDAAGHEPPFPSDRYEGCGTSIAYPIACTDVAVYKFSTTGDLIFAPTSQARLAKHPASSSSPPTEQ